MSKDLDYRVHAAITGEQPSIGFSPYTPGIVEFSALDVPEYSTDFKYIVYLVEWLENKCKPDAVECWRDNHLSRGGFEWIVIRRKTSTGHIILGEGPSRSAALCHAVLVLSL